MITYYEIYSKEEPYDLLEVSVLLIKIRKSYNHLENKHNQAVDNESSRTQPDVPRRVEDILFSSQVVYSDNCLEYKFVLIVEVIG